MGIPYGLLSPTRFGAQKLKMLLLCSSYFDGQCLYGTDYHHLVGVQTVCPVSFLSPISFLFPYSYDRLQCNIYLHYVVLFPQSFYSRLRSVTYLS